MILAQNSRLDKGIKQGSLIKPRKKVVTLLRLYQYVKGELRLVDYGIPARRSVYEARGYVVRG